MDPFDVDAAVGRVTDFADVTPVLRSRRLETGRTAVWLKAENLQQTGSFKVRGAANCLAALPPAARAAGAITCSSGNHGRAVAYVARRMGIPITVCVPQWIDPVKLSAIEADGATIERYGATYDEAERRSFALRDTHGLAYVSAFDDPCTIAGQGTIGVELHQQVPTVDTVVVPMSGGGLVAGIALALRARVRATVVAVSAHRARVMYESQRAGQPVVMDEEETLATALAGGIGPANRHTYELVRELVDHHVLVGEDEIGAAMRFAATEHKMVLEGGGATALAGLLSHAEEIPGRTVAVVLSGGNVALRTWCTIVG